MYPRLLMILFVAVCSVWFTGCSDEPDDPAASPSPVLRETPTPEGTAFPPATATAAPGPGCPVDTAYCDLALQLLPMLKSGNADALMRLAQPVETTCPSAGLGGPSPSLCAGAATGEKRSGYWDVQAGEGLIVPEADFRRTLDRWFASVKEATGSDAWGPGDLRMGAIACSRPFNASSGQCDGNVVDLMFTFINSPQTPLERGTGLPGQRVTFFVRASNAAGLKVIGFGTTVPPNAYLDSLVLSAVSNEGSPYTLESYPWKP